MNAKLLFSTKFKELMASGAHIVSSVIDGSGELQVTEIYGGELKDESELVLFLFFSDLGAPDFYRALTPSKKAAIVICSPFSMETYQAKGEIVEISSMSEENQALADYWLENYLLCLKSIGLKEETLSQLCYRPTHRFGIKINQIFAQSPEKGTGGEL